MEVKENINNDELTLSIKGRLDTLTSNDLDTKILDLSEDIKTLILDMTELDYISSAGLRVLAKAHKFIAGKQGKMVIKNVNTAVMSIFKMTGFNTILTIE